MKIKVGVVADDVTGANDIGIMFQKGGYRSAVFPLSLLAACDMEAETANLEVIIIDTDSRFDTPPVAAQKVQRATEILKKLHCGRYYNKTCSVFRGNIGAEFDRMQDVLGVSSSMVIAGFPKNGRTTVDGLHYVYGEKLEQSQFSRDPIHKMTTSSLEEIIHSQSSRSVGLITWRDLDRGLEYVKAKKDELKKDYAYVIFDVRHQEDLKLIARAVADELNICGSSAIGEELPAAYALERGEGQCFLLAGSLTEQSREQIAYMKGTDCPVYEFRTDCIYDRAELEAEMNRLVELSLKSMADQGRTLVHTSNREEQVGATKEKGQSMGMTHEQIGRLISGAMCHIAEEVLTKSGCRNLVVAGGDTSAAITQRLQIYRMEIGREIEPGVPAMQGRSSLGALNLVLKSGSFGSESFLKLAADCIS